MSRLVGFLFVVLGGCGRYAFDPLAGQDAATGDDGSSALGICGSTTVATELLVVRGFTFRYLDFQGTQARLDNTTVRALDRPSGVELGATTSDAQGDYALSLSTGGQAVDLELVFERPGVFQTRQLPDRPLDRDTTAMPVLLWDFGAGPLWEVGAIDSIYAAGGAVRDPALGTLNVAVRDCAGAIVEGATIQIDPPPGAIRYQQPDGQLGGAVSERPFATVVALNAPPGPTTVTAIMSGHTFAPQQVEVAGGEVVTMVIARALD